MKARAGNWTPARWRDAISKPFEAIREKAFDALRLTRAARGRFEVLTDRLHKSFRAGEWVGDTLTRIADVSRRGYRTIKRYLAEFRRGGLLEVITRTFREQASDGSWRYSSSIRMRLGAALREPVLTAQAAADPKPPPKGGQFVMARAKAAHVSRPDLSPGDAPAFKAAGSRQGGNKNSPATPRVPPLRRGPRASDKSGRLSCAEVLKYCQRGISAARGTT